MKIPTVWRERRNARWEKWLARWFTKCRLYTYRFSHFANIFSHSRQFDDKCIAGSGPKDIMHDSDNWEYKILHWFILPLWVPLVKFANISNRSAAVIPLADCRCWAVYISIPVRFIYSKTYSIVNGQLIAVQGWGISKTSAASIKTWAIGTQKQGEPLCNSVFW